MKTVLLGLSVAALCISPAYATPTTITFKEVATKQIASATNEYAGYGVTFDNFYYYSNETRDTFDQYGIAAYTPAASILFSQAVRNLSLDLLILQGLGSGLFQAFDSSSNLLDSYSVVAGSTNQNISHSFLGSNISRLTVTTANSGYTAISTIRFDANAGAVPEPGLWAMIILGMGAVGFAMRQRQKVITTVKFA